MGFATEGGAREILGPIEGLLTACVQRAFRKWQTEVARLFPVITRRGLRNVLYELMIQEVREAFDGLPGAQIVDTRDQRTLLIYGGLVLRFKHLDDRFRTANYPTRLAVLVDTSMTLPELPEGPRVTIGYLLNEFETELDGVYAVCFVRRRRSAWRYELNRLDKQEHLPLPAPPAEAPEPPQRRVGPKKEHLPATGKVLPFRSKK